jgi:membrane protein required for beta-lactamase induction
MVCETWYGLTTLGVEISLVVLAVGVRDRRHSYITAIRHAEMSGQL